MMHLKKSVWMVFVLVLCMMPCSVFAPTTKWEYFDRANVCSCPAACTIYIDASDIVRNGDSMFYWTLEVYDQPSGSKYIKKVTWKNEAILANSRKLRGLETYAFDTDGKEVERGTRPTDWIIVNPNSGSDRMIDFALRYAK